MVYDGRPSTGCENCRKRRVKCDESTPNCNQCIRTNRECPGYRHQHDVFFRDETGVTQLRASRPKKRKSLQKDELIAIVSEQIAVMQRVPPVTWATVQQPCHFERAISQPIKEQAVNFFFNTFVFAPRLPECSVGFLEYLPSLYRAAKPESVLPHATTALALALLVTFSVHRHQILPLARRTYGNAISKLNLALQNPVEVKQNETLMTIMLFKIIESLFASAETGHFQSSHIEGAVALLKLRGTEMSTDEVTSALFLTVRTHIIMNHFQQHTPVEQFFHHPKYGWQYKLTGKLLNVSSRLTQYILLVPALRSRAIYLLNLPRSESVAAEILGLLEECQLFDSILSSWPATIPESWQYHTVARHVSDPKDDDYENAPVFYGDLDVYHDSFVASVWNSYRCARMFVNAVIIRCIAWGCPPGIDVEANREYEVSCDRLQAMVNGVCSSVPFVFMGYSEDSGHISDHIVQQRMKSQEIVHPTYLASYFLMWPLFVARSSRRAPIKQLRWLRGRMMAIIKKLGIPQAMALVEIGDKESQRPLFAESWDPLGFENVWEHTNLYASGGI